MIRIIASAFCERNGKFHFFQIQNCQYLCVFSGISLRSATGCTAHGHIVHIWHRTFLISLFSKRQFVIYCVMFVLCFSLLYPALQPYHRKASENPPNIAGRETLTGNSGSEISYGHRRVGKLVRTSHRCAHHLQDDEESHSCIGIVSFYTLYKKIFFQEDLQNIQNKEPFDQTVHKAEAFVQPSH